MRSTLIPNTAVKVREKMRSDIQKAKDDGVVFSFTTDIWSSRANDSYISLTAHFLQGFERKNVTLSVSVFNTSHTGEQIAAKLQVQESLFNLLHATL